MWVVLQVTVLFVRSQQKYGTLILREDLGASFR